MIKITDDIYIVIEPNQYVLKETRRGFSKKKQIETINEVTLGYYGQLINAVKSASSYIVDKEFVDANAVVMLIEYQTRYEIIICEIADIISKFKK